MSEMAKLLISMNTIVKAINDEGAYYNAWICLIPDEADDEELEDIANNQEDIFEEACVLFTEIMNSKRYKESGLYVDGKVYELVEEEQ